MHRFLLLSALVLSATMISPVVGQAESHDKRYYDRDGKDYHTWNNNEDHAYRAYLQEQHKDYRAFNKVKPADQQDYFKWRHTHSDDALIKVEVK
jgi:hypothetical protein